MSYSLASPPQSLITRQIATSFSNWIYEILILILDYNDWSLWWSFYCVLSHHNQKTMDACISHISVQAWGVGLSILERMLNKKLLSGLRSAWLTLRDSTDTHTVAYMISYQEKDTSSNHADQDYKTTSNHGDRSRKVPTKMWKILVNT